jgi:hypothetical protein
MERLPGSCDQPETCTRLEVDFADFSKKCERGDCFAGAPSFSAILAPCARLRTDGTVQEPRVIVTFGVRSSRGRSPRVHSERWTSARGWLSAIAVLCAACSVKRIHDDARRPVDGSLAGGADANAGEICRSDPSARLRCDPSEVDGVPWGPMVKVHRASGRPPSPGGGAIAPGAYQLVAETLYGAVPPNDSASRMLDQMNRKLYVDCDVMNELYTSDLRFGAGNDCRRLVARSLTLLEVSGFQGVPSITDLRDQVSFTADGDRLTLIFLNAYWDFADTAIVGSYTIVSEFERVTDMPLGPPPREPDEIPTVGTSRDPRCPPGPPAKGASCSPDTSPIECEYAADPAGCTTFAECALGLDGSFSFVVDEPSCRPPNPTFCPSSFAEAAKFDNVDLLRALLRDGGTVPLGMPLVCRYAEGVCGCDKRMISLATGCIWTCRAGAAGSDGGVAAGCPWPPPLAGDPCTTGLVCEYHSCIPAESLGPSMTCVDGHWLRWGLCIGGPVQ